MDRNTLHWTVHQEKKVLREGTSKEPWEFGGRSHAVSRRPGEVLVGRRIPGRRPDSTLPCVGEVRSTEDHAFRRSWWAALVIELCWSQSDSVRCFTNR